MLQSMELQRFKHKLVTELTATIELSEREIKKIINKNVSESIKSLGINLTKEVKDLYL